MGNVDKWIANGSDISQLPKETREYTGKVYGNMGNARNYYATQEEWQITGHINWHQVAVSLRYKTARTSTQ